MIIVTGGGGFIGSNLVHKLVNHTDEPIVVCDVFGQDEKWQNLKRVGLADLVAPEELFEYLDAHKAEVSVLFHLGASSSTTEKDADLVLDSNFKFSVDLIEWCALNGVRFIYASSASTYGSGDKGFTDDDSKDFLSALSPLNVYAWSKLLVDRYVTDRRQRGKPMPPQCVGLKFFNVYGPNEYHKGNQTSVVKQIYDVIHFGSSARLFKSGHPDYKDGEQERDFIWVGDCVDVMLWLYDNPKINGLFNVGSGQARTFNDLAHAAFSALNRPVRIDYVEMPRGLPEKYQYHTKADMSRLRQAGYTRDFTSLEEGVRLYIQDYLATDDPYL